MSYLTILLFVAGLCLLVAGAEILVRGASKLAAALGISPLVVGLTVVAFGTSAPELAVSIQSSFAGGSDIALGNVIGSNIFNILFILGLSATISSLVVAQQLIRLEVPLMIGISILVFIFGLDGKIGRLNGIVLFAGIIVYTVFLIRKSRSENKEIQDEYKKEYGANGKSTSLHMMNAGLIIAGLFLLVLGARWLVNGAVAFAQLLGVSELVIGLTIVAAGTSLPEVAASTVAAFRGEKDIAVGNVVGSNLFNLLSVLGLSSIVSPDGIRVSVSALSFDIPVMIAVSVACLPVFFTGNLIARWEGLLFLGYYVAYTVYLVLYSMHHDLLPLFSLVMVSFVIPITVITIAVVTLRHMRRRK